MEKEKKNAMVEVEWQKADKQKAWKRMEAYYHGIDGIAKIKERKEEK